MQLVNIETPQTLVSSELISAIQSGKLSTAQELVTSVTDSKQIIRSLYIVSARQTKIANSISSAIVYTDALFEIIKRLFPNDAEKILKSSLGFYCSQEYENTFAENIKINRDPNSPVMVSDLLESVVDGDLEKSFGVAKTLLTVIESKNYFNELLYEIGSKFFSSSGESVIVVNSVCKALELLEWKMTDDLVWFVLNFMTNKNFRAESLELKPMNNDVKYAEYVLRAASDPGENGANLLFMGHARQVYRSVSVKYKEIWAALSSFIHMKLDDTEIVEIDEIEPVKGDINDFERSLKVKDTKLMMTLVNQILKTENNPAELFRYITLYIMSIDQFKEPEKVIYLNVARRLATALDYPRNLIIFKSLLENLFTNNISK